MASGAAQALANKLMQANVAQQQQQQQQQLQNQQLGTGGLNQQTTGLGLQPATSTQQQNQLLGGVLQPSPTQYPPLATQRQPLGGILHPTAQHQPYGAGMHLPAPAQQQPFAGTGVTQQQLAGMMQPVGAAQQLVNKLTHGSAMAPGAHNLSHDSMQQLIRSDRGSMLTMSDDHVMMNKIQETHAPDGREVDIKPLFELVEDILSRSTSHVDTILKGGLPTHVSTEIDDKTYSPHFISMLDALSFTIDRISCEIAFKALGGTDAHATTVSIFQMLTSYSWDAKLVLSLAAFALNYGEFWLLAQIYTSNPLAKSMAILKQLPFIMEHSGALKPRFDALNGLIKAMMDVTRVVVDFRQLPANYFTSEVQALSNAMSHIPTAVYWTIRSIVACATQITNLTSMGHEHLLSTVDSWELSTFTHKLKTIYDHLRQLYEYCLKHIEDKKYDEYYQMLLGMLDTLHIDNYRFLRALIYPKDDLQPLIDGSTKKSVNIDVLRRRNVLLLISGMDISSDELSILEQIYNDSRQHAARTDHSPYEIVWIPIVDPNVQWNEAMNKRLESLRSTMPWYSVYHPTIIDKAVVRFIKDVWHFRNKPVLVVLDPQGRVVCPNAIHMMWIWGSSAFPFTSLREEALWRDETWKLDLVVDSIDPEILNWIQKDRYIFLYGGDDIEWARKFTSTARSAAQIARVPIEMAYVGKSNKREQVRRAIGAITEENLSHCWDPTMIWFFWTRLESMLFSKIQLGQADDRDMVMQGIKKLLSYDKEGGWVLMSRGPQIVALGHAATGMTTLVEIDMWKVEIPEKEFHGAYKDYHDKIYDQTHSCCRFDFTSTAGKVPDRLKCPECHRDMEKFTTFKCCHDDPTQSLIYN